MVSVTPCAQYANVMVPVVFVNNIFYRHPLRLEANVIFVFFYYTCVVAWRTYTCTGMNSDPIKFLQTTTLSCGMM